VCGEVAHKPFTLNDTGSENEHRRDPIHEHPTPKIKDGADGGSTGRGIGHWVCEQDQENEGRETNGDSTDRKPKILPDEGGG
jgi:hypothetical protein